jgi:hypothetical protein
MKPITSCLAALAICLAIALAILSGVILTAAAPASGTLATTVSVLSYTDAGKIGDPTQNYYYKVLAVNAAGNKSAVASHVGEFDFGLTPGQP